MLVHGRQYQQRQEHDAPLEWIENSTYDDRDPDRDSSAAEVIITKKTGGCVILGVVVSVVFTVIAMLVICSHEFLKEREARRIRDEEQLFLEKYAEDNILTLGKLSKKFLNAVAKKLFDGAQ